MKLNQQVTSLELSQKLKELGVKQESLIYYNVPDNGSDPILVPRTSEWSPWIPAISAKIYSAFTVAELGEMLPRELQIKNEDHTTFYYWSSVKENTEETRWLAMYETAGISAPIENLGFYLADTEADARAKMLIYLLENKLVTPL